MKHRTEVRPLMADVDAMGIVYYGRYLAFCETGRAEFMRAAGMPYSQLMTQGLNLPVTECNIRYRRSARYDDPLVVQTSLAWVKKVSLRFDYSMLSLVNGNEIEMVSAYTVHGCVTDDGKVTPLPPATLELLRSLAA